MASVFVKWEYAAYNQTLVRLAALFALWWALTTCCCVLVQSVDCSEFFDQARAVQIASRLCNVKPKAAEALYVYWIQKRIS